MNRKQSAKKTDISTGLKKDSSPWTPARTYKYLCRLFRREVGNLSLSEEEFFASRNKYVGRARSAWLNRTTLFLDIPCSFPPKRKYQRSNRRTVLETHQPKDDWRWREINLVQRVYEAEFPWIILRGEGRELKLRITASMIHGMSSLQRWQWRGWA